MGDTIAQTRFENVSKFSNDLLLAGVNTPQSDEDSLKLKELMELCTTLQSRVLALEQTKASQANEIDSLKQRDASKQGRIRDIDADEDITLVSTHDEAEMFDADQDLGGQEVFVAKQDENVVEKEVDAAQVQVTNVVTTPTISINEVTLAQALAELKHTKPKAKAKGFIFHKPEECTITTAAAIHKPKSQDKERLQAEEQQELNDEENATLCMHLLEKRRKFFAAKKAEEKKNRPPTRAQQRSIMCTYLKNMEGRKTKSLKNKSFANIQELFDKAMKRVNTFVDYRTKLVVESLKEAEAEVTEGSSKRAGEKLKQENAKKQKMEDDK
nr:hypothetical protein [Tanacetum cinerariifolium]